MLKKVIVSGLLGGIILLVWTFIVNGIFGLRSSIDMNQVSNERQVYEELKGSLVEPGRYIVNPELSSSGTFPAEEPVFSIHYSGMGHDAVGKLMLFQLSVLFLAPLTGVWMLSLTSSWVLSSYARKVLFFTAIGLLFAFYSDLLNFGIDAYALKDAMILAVNDILAWTLVGLVVAWRMQLEPGDVLELT